MDEFRAGVTAVLRTWTAFRTAVESHWGGDDSLQKAEDLRRNILDHFNGASVPPKSMSDVTDLEDALAIYMEEEFALQLEDNSEKEIAHVIWQMYEQCSKGDFRLALQMVESAELVVAKVKAYPVQIQAPEHDDEEDDDDDDEEMVCAAPDAEPIAPETTTTTTIPQRTFSTIAEYASFPLFGPVPQKTKSDMAPVRQLGEQLTVPTTKAALEVDEDGFVPVKRKR